MVFGNATGNPVSRPFPKWHASALPHLGYPGHSPFCPCSTTGPYVCQGALHSARWNTTTSADSATLPLPSLRDVGHVITPTPPLLEDGLATSLDQQQAGEGTANKGCSLRGRSDTSDCPWPGSPALWAASFPTSTLLVPS